MSNDIGHNPWKIDTASATVIFSGIVWIERLVWHEPTTSGHALSITDKDGNVIWNKTALAGGSGLDYDIKLDSVYKGLIVPTLGSGTLYVHLSSKP
jgi:hypothetical protein